MCANSALDTQVLVPPALGVVHVHICTKWTRCPSCPLHFVHVCGRSTLVHPRDVCRYVVSSTLQPRGATTSHLNHGRVSNTHCTPSCPIMIPPPLSPPPSGHWSWFAMVHCCPSVAAYSACPPCCHCIGACNCSTCACRSRSPCPCPFVVYSAEYQCSGHGSQTSSWSCSCCGILAGEPHASATLNAMLRSQITHAHARNHMTYDRCITLPKYAISSGLGGTFLVWLTCAALIEPLIVVARYVSQP